MQISPIFFASIRGISQIMLQRHLATGLLFLIGIAIHSPVMAAAAWCASLSATLFAYLAKFPKAAIEDGLYGFNAALVAIAVLLFYTPSPWVLALLAIALIFATLLMHFLHKYQLMPLTFPFILTVWLLLWLYPANNTIALQGFTSGIALLDSFLQGFAQVMLQNNSLTGAVFIIALIVGHWQSALVAVFASALAVFLAQILAFDSNLISSGIYAYNAVLTAIAVIVVCRQKALLVPGIILSIFFTHVFIYFHLVALTFPFVLATWLMALLAKNKYFKAI